MIFLVYLRLCSGDTLNGVLATKHSATEVGACELPEGSYAVINPVALGDIASLKNLKYRPAMCGQVLSVSCGGRSLDIIVSNANLGGGLDLYSSSWDILTNRKPPGSNLSAMFFVARKFHVYRNERRLL